jgi:hypothetical protein
MINRFRIAGSDDVAILLPQVESKEPVSELSARAASPPPRTSSPLNSKTYTIVGLTLVLDPIDRRGSSA